VEDRSGVTDDRIDLAARAGRWSARHWKRATGIWLGFVVLRSAVASVNAALRGVPQPKNVRTGAAGEISSLQQE
jgi:hypothetical protein